MPARSVKESSPTRGRNPGKLSYGTSAAGSSPQLAMELFKLTAKIDVVYIPYKGAPQALTDTIGGQIPASVQSAPGALSAIEAGRVRALAVTSLKRIPQCPQVPTMDETALPGFEVNSWYGLCAPAGTPAPMLDKVHADLTAVLRMPEIQQRLQGHRDRSRADQPRGIRAVHPRRDRALGAGDQGGRDPAGVERGIVGRFFLRDQ